MQYSDHERQQIMAALTKKFRTSYDLYKYMYDRMVSAPSPQR